MQGTCFIFGLYCTGAEETCPVTGGQDEEDGYQTAETDSRREEGSAQRSTPSDKLVVLKHLYYLLYLVTWGQSPTLGS